MSVFFFVPGFFRLGVEVTLSTWSSRCLPFPRPLPFAGCGLMDGRMVPVIDDMLPAPTDASRSAVISCMWVFASFRLLC